MSRNDSPEDKALKYVEELLKTIIATSGIMLALLWGLTQRAISLAVLNTVRWASIVFVLSIFISLLGGQFIVSRVQQDDREITKKGPVPLVFLLAWLTFVVGCALLILAIFRLNVG